ncbi:MAG: hypothetical protein ACOX12_07720 [Eggerthellaceae bacterium]|jgi:hypothetical protein
MIKFLVLLVILALVIIAFRMGRQSERGRLIDLEPDESQSEKWASKTAKDAGSKRAQSSEREDDVIDVSPDDVEVVDK